MPAGWAAAAAVGGAYMSSEAQKDSASSQEGLARDQMARDQAGYEEQKQLNADWRDAGVTALRDIQNGINNGSFDPGQFHFDAKSMEQDPGYKFRMSEGNRLATQRLGAGGKYFSTQGQKALIDYNQNAASNEFQNAYQRGVGEYNMEATRLGNKYNVLRDQSVTGQNSANQTASDRGQLMSAEAGQTNAIGNAYQNSANATSDLWNNLGSAGAFYAGTKYDPKGGKGSGENQAGDGQDMSMIG
jgi:hypothetical protein